MPPGDQVYELPPPAVIVVVPPAQIVAGEALAVITGLVNVTTLTAAAPVQLFAAPISVYELVVSGQTVAVAPVVFIGSQVYEVAPDPDNCTQVPGQTAVCEATAITVGFWITFTATVAVPGQPDPEEPVTVKIVEAVIVTGTVEPVMPPGCQV